MKRKINFKFKSNWKLFYNWFEKRKLQGVVTSWTDQRSMIQRLFEKEVPKTIDWNLLWRNQNEWFDSIVSKKKEVLWVEQTRQIETLLLNQISAFDENTWMVICKDTSNRPYIFVDGINHDNAVKAQRKLVGDENGVGGRDDIDQAVVVNLNSFF